MTIIELQAMKMIGIFMTETIDDNEPDDVLGRIEEGAEVLPRLERTFRNTREAANVT